MKLHRLLGLGLAISALAVAGVGCSSDDEEEHSHEDGGHHDLSPECQAIVDACHEVDTGDPGDIHTCHESAHEDDSAYCTAEGATCIALCEAAAMDSGAQDAGHD